MKISYQLTGVERLKDNLDRLTVDIRDKLVKKVMKKVITPIQRAMIAKVSTDTGTLKSAIQQKITSKGAKGAQITGIVGIRRGVKMPVRIVTRGANKGKLYVLVPSRYAHLIEFGHKIVVSAIWEKDPNSKHGRLRRVKTNVSGNVVGFARARPFVRPAWDQYGKEVALKAFLVELDKEVATQVSTYNKGP